MIGYWFEFQFLTEKCDLISSTFAKWCQLAGRFNSLKVNVNVVIMNQGMVANCEYEFQFLKGKCERVSESRSIVRIDVSIPYR